MAKFTKQILTPGFYVVSDGKGNRRPEFISPDRIAHWANQHTEMRKAGLNIPAPDFHDADSIPAEQRESSKNNYGFWEQLSVDQDGSLNGVLEVPVDSDAERIEKGAVREVSIYADDQFVDGKGRLWKDVLTHIALVTRPIEPGQKPFHLAMSHRLPIQMNSEIMDAMDKPGMSGDLFTMLETVAGISIPKGTSDDELPRALMAALLQKQLSENPGSSSGSLTKPPSKSSLTEVPIVMSQQQQKKKDDQVPETPVAPAGNTDPVVMSLQNENAGLKKVLARQKQSELLARVQRLRTRNIIDDETLKALNTEIGTIQMSFDSNGEVPVSPVERTITILEGVKVNVPAGAKPVVAMADRDDSGNYVIEPFNTMPEGNPSVTDERADEIMKQLFSQTSV